MLTALLEPGAAMTMRYINLLFTYLLTCVGPKTAAVWLHTEEESETMKSLVFAKEKELALALMKVAELTSQLDQLRASTTTASSEDVVPTSRRPASTGSIPDQHHHQHHRHSRAVVKPTTAPPPPPVTAAAVLSPEAGEQV